MTTLEPPRRDEPRGHRCVCVLIHGGRDGRRDPCSARTASPDNPFCDDCEQAGHADLPQARREERA